MRGYLFLFFTTIFLALSSFAHSGGTNSSGCHNDYINGGYHCHKSQSISPTIPVNRQLNDDLGPSRSPSSCCKVCYRGKACGDTCISRSKICHVGVGCACDG